MTHTSERRPYTCWKLQVRAQLRVGQNGLYPARWLPFLPGHSNSIRTRNGCLFVSARLFMPRTPPTYRWKTGNWIKFAAERADRTKERSGISSGMIYLTRSVLIRAYYMRDRGPRRASAVWPYANTYHLRSLGSTHPVASRLSKSCSFSRSTLSLYVYINAAIQLRKRRKSKAAEIKDIFYIWFIPNCANFYSFKWQSTINY